MVAKPPKGPTEVTAYDHDETRTNIPTADAAAEWFDDESATLPPVPFERVITDPELIWRGKTDDTLLVDAPPIYIQEKVDPRALIANLRKQTTAPSAEEPSLFDFADFDQLGELDAVEFYQHEESWKNRMILGDSLQVMGSLAEREALRGKVQMIYIDPPYGIKFGSNWQARTNKRDVKDGKLEDAAREAEQIKAFRDTWELGIHSYLSYLRDRLVVARELLTDSGSVFVQIGDENVHLVRNLMDEVFGSSNLCSQIAFAKTTGLASALMPEGIDYLLWYAKDVSKVKAYTQWRSKSREEGSADTYSWLWFSDGSYRGMTKAERDGSAPIDANAAIYKPDNITSQGNPVISIDLNGRHFSGPYKTTVQGMTRLGWAGRLHEAKNSLQYRRLLSDFDQIRISNLWTDTGTGSFTDDKVYVVQTGTKTIQRCLLMTTDPGDLVLDPTCGAGTTAFVAEQWGRRWITIDTSRVALALARQRIMGAKFAYYVKLDSDEGRRLEGLPPAATGGDLRAGFVYERVPHITLGSIANNPDIREGMTREEVTAAINRHADFELLRDRPKDDRSKVRVSGPFTVESLSPHRSVSFDKPEALHGAEDDAATGFDEMILANLRRAGIQNGQKAQRIEFASL